MIKKIGFRLLFCVVVIFSHPTYSQYFASSVVIPSGLILGCPDGGASLGGGGAFFLDTAIRDSVPVFLSDFPDFQSLSFIPSIYLALDLEGNLWGQGANNYGQLGIGDTINRSSWLKNTWIDSVSQINYSFFGYGLAVAGENRELYYFGFSDPPRHSGDRNLPEGRILKPTKITALEGIIDLDVKFESTVAVLEDGTCWGWGENNRNQLGDTTAQYIVEPSRINGLENIVQVSRGYSQTYFLDRSGDVYAVGFNNHGCCGSPNEPFVATPNKLAMPVPVVKISANDINCLMLAADSTVWVVGFGGLGQFGNGDTKSNHIPLKVPGISGAVDIHMGRYYAVARLKDETIMGWGANGSGVLGLGYTQDTVLTPKQMLPYCQQGTAIHEAKPLAIQVIPNPSHNGVFTVTQGSKDGRWVVFNMQGQQVAKGMGQRINLSHQPTGMYFLQQQGHAVKVAKLIIH